MYMFEGALFEWIGTMVASGGIGAAITYFINLRSNKRKAIADAVQQEERAE
jgi:hypothetical protein